MWPPLLNTVDANANVCLQELVPLVVSNRFLHVAHIMDRKEQTTGKLTVQDDVDFGLGLVFRQSEDEALVRQLDVGIAWICYYDGLIGVGLARLVPVYIAKSVTN